MDIQSEVGEAAYDAGAEILYTLFRQCLAGFMQPDLAPLGRQIIEVCLDRGTVQDYQALVHAE